VSDCGHDGWAPGCPICALEEQLAVEAMGERVELEWPVPVRDDDERPVPLDEEDYRADD
jgi:hypothetical protein